MPHYDYFCLNCGHEKKNIFQKITEDSIRQCPHCLGETFNRRPGGGIGLQFHGEGFYINDYDSQKAASKKEASIQKSCGCGKPTCDAS